MKNKIFIGIFLMIILIANVSFASYSTVTMEIVEEPICTIALTENSKFEKKLISKDLSNKEVTLQLQVTNEEVSNKPTGEIMLVLDYSNSMTNLVAENTTRRDLVFESAKTLVSNLLKDNTNLKIGIVKFSTVDITTEAVAEDASVVANLTNDVTTLTNAISSIETNGHKTDLQAGLLLASQQFTKTKNNKYMIVLTDGIPNVVIGNNDYYSDEVINKTKEQLQTLDEQGIDIITMLTGINGDNSETPPNAKPITRNDKTYGEIVEEIFGTQDNPTVGNFYYVTDNQAETTITNDIYNSLVSEDKTLRNIKIVDYFPAEIINNFDFAYVSEANIGSISATVDKTNNSITWTIPELAAGQTATVQYKLKLKENFDSSIVNKILNTNEKVDVDYTDLDGSKQTKTSNVSPKIKLTEPPTALPKAGTITLIGFAVLASGLLIYSVIKLTVVNKKMK